MNFKNYFTNFNIKQFVYFLIISSLLITIILITFVFFPSSTAPQKNLILKKIYYADNISPAHKVLINSFNDIYKGQIEVVPINLPFEKFSTNERKELLARFLRSKSDRLDLFAVDQIWVPRFTKWTLPLEDLLNDSIKTNFLSYAVKTCKYDEKLYAIPLYIDIAVMYYRKDLLRKEFLDGYNFEGEIDFTWEEFLPLLSKVKSEVEHPFLFPAYNYEGIICFYLELMKSLGKDLIEEGRLQLTSHESKKALDFIVKLIQNQYSPEAVSNFTEQQVYNSFISEDAFAIRGWPNFQHEQEEKLKAKNIYHKVEAGATPYFKEGKKVSVFGGWNLMVSKYTNKQKEVIKFLEFISSREAQKIMFEHGGYLPVHEKIYSEHDYISENKILSFYYDLFKFGFHRPQLQVYTRISDIISYYINGAVKGEWGADEALQMAEEKINSEFKSIY